MFFESFRLRCVIVLEIWRTKLNFLEQVLYILNILYNIKYIITSTFSIYYCKTTQPVEVLFLSETFSISYCKATYPVEVLHIKSREVPNKSDGSLLDPRVLDLGRGRPIRDSSNLKEQLSVASSCLIPKGKPNNLVEASRR